jgi:hypothetical protein
VSESRRGRARKGCSVRILSPPKTAQHPVSENRVMPRYRYMSKPWDGGMQACQRYPAHTVFCVVDFFFLIFYRDARRRLTPGGFLRLPSSWIVLLSGLESLKPVTIPDYRTTISTLFASSLRFQGTEKNSSTSLAMLGGRSRQQNAKPPVPGASVSAAVLRAMCRGAAQQPS